MFLLDTNIISEVRKGQNCNSGVARWYSIVQQDELYISTLVVGEIRKGIEQLRRRNDTQQVAALEGWLQVVMREFANRALRWMQESLRLGVECTITAGLTTATL